MADRLYTMAEACATLKVSRRWLQDFLKTHRHYRLVGKRKRFSPADLDAIVEALPRPSDSPADATVPTSTFEERLPGFPSVRVRESPSNPRTKRRNMLSAIPPRSSNVTSMADKRKPPHRK